MSHYNSAQSPTMVNRDVATLDSPGGEEHDVPSHSSRLIPEYANLCTSGLRQKKRVQDKDKKEKVIQNVFGIIYIFASVAMSVTKSILT